jgi:NitT/TauT family transport system substrate-binding protein
VGTPQFGNTQDVSARAWFKEHGLSITLGGGDVSIIPTTGPDQLLLFLRGDLDGVWAVEPWLSRLELEGGGELLVNEPDALTTLLVASAQAIAERGELVQKFVAAHEELTQWLVSNPTESQEILRRELGKHVGKDLPQELVARSWSRLSFSTAISPTDFQDFLLRAQSVGFLPGAASVEGIVAASGADSKR